MSVQSDPEIAPSHPSSPPPSFSFKFYDYKLNEKTEILTLVTGSVERFNWPRMRTCQGWSRTAADSFLLSCPRLLPQIHWVSQSFRYREVSGAETWSTSCPFSVSIPKRS